MKQQTKSLALLTAAAMLTVGISAELPRPLASFAETESLQSFAAKLAAMQETDHSAYFSKLEFQRKEGKLLLDGKDAGSGTMGFRVMGGKLMADASMVGGEKGRMISLQEAQQTLGLEVYETDDSVIVSAPFQTATLIVKSDADIPQHGAVNVVSGYQDLHVLQYDSPAEAYAAYQAYETDSKVTYVEPNLIVHACFDEEEGEAVPDEARWGQEAIGSDDYLSFLATQKQPDRPIIAAVLDTGLYEEHEMFEGRVAAGGISFETSSADTYADVFGHGSHCAGIICSVTNENVKILPVKILDDGGYGSNLSIYCGMMYAAEQNVDVVSMSLGCICESPMLNEGARALQEKDIVLVAAAGNESFDCKYSSPANIPYAFTVSAVGHNPEDDTYTLADFSNFGMGIDFAAPGVNIRSVAVTAPDAYVEESGTSMATPFVAGCVASLLCYNPDLTTAEIYDLLKANALDLGEAGFDKEFGWGMVQLGGFAFDGEGVQAPVASFESGVYHHILPVTLEAADGATVIYTLDGTMPTMENGIVYRGEAIRITRSTVLKAKAFMGDASSKAMTVRYEIACDPPVASVASGSFTKGFDITFEKDENSDVFYTLDGSVPDKENGICYDGGKIHIAGTTVLRAVGIIGDTVSDMQQYTYVFDDGQYQKLFRIVDGVLLECMGDMAEVNLAENLQDVTLTAIGDDAFRNCKQLENLVLPKTVTEIGAYAFAGCVNLRQITATGVTTIGAYAFSDCMSLNQLDLGTLHAIPEGAFNGCGMLDLGISKVRFEDIKVVPENAFRNCSGLTRLELNWEEIQEIGAHAFQHVSLWGIDMTLTNLEKLGVGAFEDAYGSACLKLPETITEVPAYAFRNCSMESIEMMGVTKIDECGLNDLYCRDLMMDFGAITEIGYQGMMGYHFYQNVSFDALTVMDVAAFASTSGDMISLPQVKEVPDEAFLYSEIGMILLENVETIGYEAIRACKGLVVGEQLQHVEELESFATELTDYYAGPADSPLQKIAKKNGIPYIVTPAVYVPKAHYQSGLYRDLRIQAYPMGFGYAYQWHCYDSDAADATELALPEDGRQPELWIDTNNAGDTYYRLEMQKNGETIAVSDAITVTVVGLPETATAATQEKTLIDWNTVATVADVMPQMLFTYTAPQSGTYYLYSADNTAEVRVLMEDDEDFIQEGNGWYPEQLIPLELEKGKTYRILVTAEEYYCRYNMLCISETLPALGTFMDELKPAVPAVERKDVAQLVPVTVTDYEGNLLDENVDYLLYYDTETNPNAVTVYAFGNGEYGAVLVSSYVVYEDMESERIFAPWPDYETQYYRFVPKKSGSYTFSLELSEDLEQRMVAGAVPYEEVALMFPVMDLLDEDMSSLTYYDDETELSYSMSWGFMLTVELQAGETYYVTLNNYTFDTYAWQQENDLLLCANYEKTDIGTCNFEMGESPFFTGEPLSPEIILTDGDTVLVEGEDYTLTLWNNILPGNGCYLIRGMGQYYGNILSNFLISMDLESEDSVDAFLMAGEELEFAGEYTPMVFYCMAPGEYELTVQPETENTTVYVYEINMFFGWLTLIKELDTGTNTLQLGEGMYLFMVQQADEGTGTILLEEVDVTRDLGNGYAYANAVPYTGETVEPTFFVYYDTDELEAGVDYEIIAMDEWVESGLHVATLRGMGVYTGELQVTFLILGKFSADSDLLQDGSNQIGISEAGAVVTMLWRPTEAYYGFRKQCIDDVHITIHNGETMEMIGEILGQDYIFQTISGVEQDVDYYVTICYGSTKKTGSFTLDVIPNYRSMEDVTVEMDTEVMAADVAVGAVPAFRLTYQGEELTEGEDYRVMATGGSQYYGQATRTFAGIGDYCGTVKATWYVYPDLNELDMADLMTEELTLDALVTPALNLGGAMQCFTFVAPETATYGLAVYDSFEANVPVFVYNEMGMLQPVNERMIDLKKGETIQLLAIASRVEGEFFYAPEIGVTSEIPPERYTLETEDGFVYAVIGEEASIISMPVETVGVMLADTVYDSERDRTLTVVALEDPMMGFYTNDVTFYVNAGTALSESLLECYFNVVLIGTESETYGDVTGDMVVDERDATALMRVVNEASGMWLPEENARLADADGDGMLTILDVVFIMEQSGEAVG